MAADPSQGAVYESPVGEAAAPKILALQRESGNPVRKESGKESNLMRDLLKTISAQEDLLRRQEDLLRINNAYSQTLNAVRSLSENSAIQRALEDAQRISDMARLAHGPLEDIRRLSAMTQLPNPLGQISEIGRNLESRFHLPAIEEATRLLRQFEEGGAYSALRRLHAGMDGVQRAMESMRTPWLDIQDKVRSLGGFVELQGIGAALSRLPTFDPLLAESLRADLGDWRVRIDWPPDIFTDIAARTNFYEQRGLNLRLTDLPAAAFEESATLAGLAGPAPDLERDYEPEIVVLDSEEDGFERTNRAHDRLQRFETQVRRFIDERMRAAFGPDWVKHRVPGEIRQRWHEKKQAAVKTRQREWPLIAYADFTDYVPIITRTDNWEAAFKDVFDRTESVRESFQRLYPIRICTMHARLISQDDELYLWVETKRISASSAIKSDPNFA